jgi:hypothetical protein
MPFNDNNEIRQALRKSPEDLDSRTAVSIIDGISEPILWAKNQLKNPTFSTKDIMPPHVQHMSKLGERGGWSFS